MLGLNGLVALPQALPPQPNDFLVENQPPRRMSANPSSIRRLKTRCTV
jgi:hypothetical protein